MAKWRSLRGVALNFLATLTNRSSDYKGWWIFGLIEPHLDGLEVDLLANPSRDKSPIGQFKTDAFTKFHDQMRKHDLPTSFLRSAALHGKRLCNRSQVCGDHRRDGSDFNLTVVIETTTDKQLAPSRTIFVAPHDPALEGRSLRHQRAGIRFLRDCLSRLRYRIWKWRH